MPATLCHAFPTLVSIPTADAAVPAAALDPIAKVIQLVLAAPGKERRGGERRREQRHPFPYPIHLTPLDSAGQPLTADAVTVLGKHLSSHGLDFYHRKPLACRRAIVSMPGLASAWIGLLMDLTWCRFSEHGWYDNGGRFLAIVDSPLNVHLG